VQDMVYLHTSWLKWFRMHSHTLLALMLKLVHRWMPALALRLLQVMRS
jgi:hypothetical protein